MTTDDDTFDRSIWSDQVAGLIEAAPLIFRTARVADEEMEDETADVWDFAAPGPGLPHGTPSTFLRQDWYTRAIQERVTDDD